MQPGRSCRPVFIPRGEYRTRTSPFHLRVKQALPSFHTRFHRLPRLMFDETSLPLGSCVCIYNRASIHRRQSRPLSSYLRISFCFVLLKDMAYSHQAPEVYPPPPSTAYTSSGPYVAPPPPVGYPMRDGQPNPQNAPPVVTKSRGDGFWKGCCAALCCCCVLDACF